ncbi:hypothetical protein AJ78_07293 [Emergomyces pasteurianus Ep9510]|uniref:DUF4211 domain-containing protein n=1 Tax=Emergomyces pasteurianus Ep9510 TaxID=1447872 RepID=A0A1J9PVZ2_9EURO|nr:hypothetical protein AJ78_07293 [Emergomyces pasteurianus Ep9510]
MPPSARPVGKLNAQRQTRLSFTPLTPSSPGFERSPGSDRAATMRYGNAFSSSSAGSPIRNKTEPISKLFQSSKSEDISSDEESIHAPSSSRRPLKRLIIKDMDEDEDDGEESEDIVCSSPAKRRRLNMQAEVSKEETPRSRTERAKLDLEEDLEDLRDSAMTKTRTRGRAADKAKIKRQTQLEALRRRRAEGKREVVSVESSEDESNAKQTENKSSSQEEDEEEETGDEGWNNLDEDSDVEPPVPEDLDKYEDDFIDQDEEGALGAPDELNDIPFEFTRHRYKRLRDHFKDVVEWMVHNKLNPAFPRDDVVYRMAFSKVTDQVTGLAGSQLISSAWNRDFRKALEARPGIDVTLYPVSLGHSCDACNKTNHPASFDIQFNGKPYLLETLEPVSDDDDDDDGDSDSDSDEQADDESGDREHGNIDREGNEIPNARTHFYLGRHCKTKAAMAHTLIHWRYHLNEWIIDFLQRKGIFSDTEILEREHWSQKKRTKYANQVVDDMEEGGEVNRLWRDFNTNLKAAREAKVRFTRLN